MSSLKNSPHNIYALHGFLGLPSDWNPFPFVTHPVPIQHSELDLQTWGKKFNATIPRDNHKNILLGYSMGGRLAMHALLNNPTIWDAAIFVSAHPGLESEQERTNRFKNDQQWAERFLNDPWKNLMKDWNSNPVFGSHPFPFPRNEDMFNRKQLSQQLTNWSLGKQEPLIDRLRKLSTPLLIIAGEYDTKFCDIAKNFIPFAKVAIIPKAAHRVPWDQPASFKNQMLNFMQEIL
jgi:2-succinyl-6-hydroxy-2,4-cyclohexadiene-1-carboxylate synthase